ncbi:MAG: penicillin-binding protein 2 [Candidatus Dadabacteria bacterium]|nr:penicillin-binding protein 2 [Candidatus Dadabacteria bacterium]
MELLKHRFRAAFFFVAVFFIIFSARLFYLQIYKGEEYRIFSEKNVLRMLELPAPRGRIFDRNGEKILYNKPSFNLKVFPKEITNSESLAEKLAEILDIPEKELREKLRKIASLESFHPITIAKDISREELFLIEKNVQALESIFIELGHKRFYPHGEAAAVLLGYTGLADTKEVNTLHKINPRDEVGKMGVEKVFDSELRGTNGLNYIAVNAHGKTISAALANIMLTLRNKEVISGKDIHLTIDAQLQTTADDALGEEKGTIVVMDVKNGEILAMASRPSYNSEHIWKKLSPEQENKKREKYFSFFNRSIQGTYPPGSVLKIVTAFALLEEKTADPKSSVYCPGYYFINKKRFNCWRKEGHGFVNLHKAVVESCDVYFYERSLKLGVDKLHSYLKKFGLGEKTGIVLPEKKGINPSTAWKRKYLKEPWYKGETIIMAIGQGYVTATPLQINLMTAVVANGGTIVRPKIRKTDKTTLSAITGTVKSFDQKSLDFLKKALYDAVNSERGTGIYARSKIVSVSGKTGTAQVVSAKFESTKKRFQDHAWFTAYAPSDSPEISVTVLVENGGSGGVVAAPMAKKVIETYFTLKKQREETQIAESE